MFKIDGKQNIYITRGDSVSMDITLTQPLPPYEEYTLQTGDKLVFTVRETAKTLEDTPEILIQKEFTDNRLELTGNDTAELEYGKYVYDIQLIFNSGEINTVIPYTIGKLPGFNVCEEVG